MGRARTGGVHQQDNGRWKARWSDPFDVDADGKPKQRSQTFRTKQEAKDKLARLSADTQRGDYLSRDRALETFAKHADDWLNGDPNLKPRTRDGYRSILNAHLIPRFGRVPIGTIDLPAMQAFIREMKEDGKSANTIKNVNNVARKVFRQARLVRAISTNPCDDLKLNLSGMERSFEACFLSARQVEELADAMPSRADAVLVTLAAYTGLRAGELWALRRKDVDLLRRTLRVSSSASYVAGEVVFGPPKSKASRRTVPLPPFLAELVAAHLDSRPTDVEAFVFEGIDGQRHDLWYGRVWRPVVAALAKKEDGFPAKLRFHDLRHTCASLLINAGADAHAVAARLGHSTVQLTWDTYTHLFKEREDALTDALEVIYAERHSLPSGARVVPIR